jgi:uncharacterized protein (TIGR02453 family)
VTSSFSPKALAFLRALKRNNDRDWFKARREQYELLLRGPMIAIIGQLADEFRGFAPDLVASPKASLYRIYRDTRFSENQAPLKTSVAAVFPHRDLPKHQGAGLYFHVDPEGIWIGGGMYAPDTSQLQAVREHVAANVRRLRTIVESPGFRRKVGSLEGERLQRVPRGFPRDHAAAEYLKFRQFLAGKELPASFASSPRFYREVVQIFRHVAPLVGFLNEPLLQQAGRAGKGRRGPALPADKSARAGAVDSKARSSDVFTRRVQRTPPCAAAGQRPHPLVRPRDAGAGDAQGPARGDGR